MAVREAAARQQADEESQRARTVYREAAAQYTKAFELLEELVASTPKDSGHRRKLAAIYNELAWFLVVSPDLKLRDPPHAVQLAEMAVQQTGSDATCWRTLGAAQYRMERWKECIDALEKSRSLTAEPAPCELLFMAMAHRQLGANDAARACYEKYAAQTGHSSIADDEVRELDREARTLLGIEESVRRQP